MNGIIRVFLIAWLGLLVGCAQLAGPRPNDPEYAPVPVEAMKIPKRQNGAIYQEGFSLSLFETIRAKRVGDILTIVLNEKTDAAKKATTKGSKNSNTDITNPTLFGSAVQFNTTRALPLASNSNNNLSFNLKGDRSFDGKGESAQNNSITGTISVTITERLPNGNFRIRGEKWVNINQGEEFIRIKGIVRPQDISSSNEVLSTRVADARISYSGTGQVANNNKEGWLSRFFNSKWFPF